MKIYIQHKKVQTKILDRTLYFPIRYKYVSKKFKARTEKDKKFAEEHLKKAKDVYRDKSSAHSEFLRKYNKKSQQDAIHLTKLMREKENADSDVKKLQLNLDRITKNFNEPKTLEFIFGVNVFNRAADGLFVYNSHRLILMYEHTKQQTKSNDFRGIVGIVDVPRMVLEPAHNKQHFMDKREEQSLIAELGNYMEHYLKELMAHTQKKLNLDFWRPFGYSDMDFRFMPSDDESFKRKRIQNTTLLVQCDNKHCLKWRAVAWNRRNLQPGFPSDDWECKNNTEVGKDSCRLPENLGVIELKDIKRTNEDIQIIEKQPRAGFSLVEKSRDQIVGQSIPNRRDSESSTAFLKKKRREMASAESDSNSEMDFDNSQDTSLRSERLLDPDYRANGNNIRKKKKTRNNLNSIDENNEAEGSSNVQSIFERNIIEEESFEPLNRVKPEPNEINNSFTRIAPNVPARYSFESGIEINNTGERPSLGFSPRIQNDFRNETMNTMRNSLRILLVSLSQNMDDMRLVESFRNMNECDLSNVNIKAFLESYQKNQSETQAAELKAQREKYKYQAKKVLKRRLSDSHKVSEITDQIFAERTDTQNN